MDDSGGAPPGKLLARRDSGNQSIWKIWISLTYAVNKVLHALDAISFVNDYISIMLYTYLYSVLFDFYFSMDLDVN